MALKAKGVFDAAQQRLIAAVELGLVLCALGRRHGAAEAFERALALRHDMAAARLKLDRLSPGSERSAETALAAPRRRRCSIRRQSGPSGGRLTRYLAQFIDEGEHPRMGYYPGLNTRPWHDPQNFPIVQVLEEEWQTIRREVLALEAAAFHIEVVPSVEALWVVSTGDSSPKR
jgi:hypothetical protein